MNKKRNFFPLGSWDARDEAKIFEAAIVHSTFTCRAASMLGNLFASLPSVLVNRQIGLLERWYNVPDASFSAY